MPWRSHHHPPSRWIPAHAPTSSLRLTMTLSSLLQFQSLKAGVRWREQGETSAGYLKNASRQRLAQRQIPELQDPDSGVVGSTLEHMHMGACNFYQYMYPTEDIDDQAIEEIFSHIPSSCSLDSSDCALLESLLTLHDLADAVKRSPKSSSSGLDVFPYSILSLLFNHELYTDLLSNVYNEALQWAIYPASWMETCLCLLPKKGDLTMLTNWRPIAVINTDFHSNYECQDCDRECSHHQLISNRFCTWTLYSG